VSLPADLRGAGVSAIAISRDGSRAALVVGPPGHAALFVSAFSEAHGAPVISGDAVVLQPTEAVSGLAWAGSNRIATTVRRGPGQRAVVLTSVDGYRPHTVSSIGLPANPTQVAAAPGQPLLAGAGGGVYSLSNRAWTRVSSGRDPSYAG
jgi:hypothetical protein